MLLLPRTFQTGSEHFWSLSHRDILLRPRAAILTAIKSQDEDEAKDVHSNIHTIIYDSQIPLGFLPRNMSTSMLRVSLFCWADLPYRSPTFSQFSCTNLTIFFTSSVAFLDLYFWRQALRCMNLYL